MKRIADEENRVREDRIRRNQEVLDDLINQSNNHKQAAEIRSWVKTVSESPEVDTASDTFRNWRDWALRPADSLDPLTTTVTMTYPE